MESSTLAALLAAAMGLVAIFIPMSFIARLNGNRPQANPLLIKISYRLGGLCALAMAAFIYFTKLLG